MARIKMRMRNEPDFIIQGVSVSSQNILQIESVEGHIRNHFFRVLDLDEDGLPYEELDMSRRIALENEMNKMISINHVKSDPRRMKVINDIREREGKRFEPGIFYDNLYRNMFRSVSQGPTASYKERRSHSLDEVWASQISLSDFCEFSEIGLYASKAERGSIETFQTPEGDTIEITCESMGYGKGFSKESSRKSAAMELLERSRSASFYDEGNRLKAKVKDVVEDPDFLLPENFVNCMIHPLNDDLIEWNTVTDLMTGEEKHAPIGVVYFLSIPSGKGFDPFIGLSTGLAASDNYQSSLQHALFELVERDHNKITDNYPSLLKRIRNESVPDEERRIVEELEKHGVSTEINLGVTDGLPYFFEVEMFDGMNGYIGSRYHPNPVDSLRGALSEAAMARLVSGKPSYSRTSRRISDYKKGMDFSLLRDLSYGDAYQTLLSDLDKRGIKVYGRTLYKGPEGFVVKALSPQLIDSSVTK